MAGLAEHTDAIEPRPIDGPVVTVPRPPETFEDCVSLAADRSVRGEGGLREHRENLFRDVVAFITERGSTSRGEIIEEFCPPGCAGYSDPQVWYSKSILAALETVTDGRITLGRGEVRCPERLEALAFDDLVERVAFSKSTGDYGQELFIEVGEFIRERGAVTRGEIIEEFYDEDDNAGFSDPGNWYRWHIKRPLDELVSLTDAVEYDPNIGEIRYSEALEVPPHPPNRRPSTSTRSPSPKKKSGGEPDSASAGRLRSSRWSSSSSNRE